MRYLTDIDMSQNELKNAVFHTSTSAPANPKIGQIYTDTSGTTNKLMWFNGEKWISLGASAPEKVPTIIEPSVSISVDTEVEDGNVEVGTTIPISFKATFNKGSYSYGPDTGITVKSWRVYDTSDIPNESSNYTGTFSDVVVEEDTKYKVIVEATHTAGTIPLTDQGTPYPSAQILEGTKTASSTSISGFRKYFYGVSSVAKEINSEYIRSLTHSTSAVSSGTSFDLSIEKGTNQVIIAIPSSAGLALTSVIDTGAFNINVYDIFDKVIVGVEGANGYDAVNYDVYVYTPDVSLSANTYKVTIS